MTIRYNLVKNMVEDKKLEIIKETLKQFIYMDNKEEVMYVQICTCGQKCPIHDQPETTLTTTATSPQSPVSEDWEKEWEKRFGISCSHTERPICPKCAKDFIRKLLSGNKE